MEKYIIFLDPRLSLRVMVLPETQSGTPSTLHVLCILDIFGYFSYVFGISNFWVRVFYYSFEFQVKFQFFFKIYFRYSEKKLDIFWFTTSDFRVFWVFEYIFSICLGFRYFRVLVFFGVFGLKIYIFVS